MFLVPKESVSEENETRSDAPSSRTKTSGAGSEVAGWGPRAQRQTKSVWHSARNGPIACIFNGAEKPPVPIGGFFRRRIEKREERGQAGCHC